MTDEEQATRIRVSVATYEHHRKRAGEPDGDPDASWWYAAWGAELVPVLREALGKAAPRVIEGVALDLSRTGGFGWSCQCGRDDLALLRGSNADFTIRCGCGRTFIARLEEVTG